MLFHVNELPELSSAVNHYLCPYSSRITMAAAHSVLAVVLLFTVYGAAPDDIITSQSVFYLY